MSVLCLRRCSMPSRALLLPPWSKLMTLGVPGTRDQ